MTILVKTLKVESDDTLNYKSNPKRPGFSAHARYEIYSDATNLTELETIADDNEVNNEPLRKKMRADLNYDFEHGHLTITDSDDVEWTYDRDLKKHVAIEVAEPEDES